VNEWPREAFVKLECSFCSSPSSSSILRSAPTTPGTPTAEENTDLSDKKSGQIKSRIESWIKDAETDAEKAKEYLGRKREKLREVEAKRSNKRFKGHEKKYENLIF
jgi:hypothetical protein